MRVKPQEADLGPSIRDLQAGVTSIAERCRWVYLRGTALQFFDCIDVEGGGCSRSVVTVRTTRFIEKTRPNEPRFSI